MTKKARILGVGMYVPERIVTNKELETIKEMETTDEWIKTRTGIESRRYASDTQTGTDLAEIASREAIKNAGLTPDDIDFIIYATLSPDYYFPGNGCFLQDQLFGDRTVGALDVRNQCTGFLYSLTIANSMIQSCFNKHVLVVGSEVHSRALDYTKDGRNVAVLFGDGAGAAVVGPAQDDHPGILASALHSEGKHAKDLWLECPSNAEGRFMTYEDIDAKKHYPKMNGRVVFKHAVTRMVEVVNEVLQKANKSISDIQLTLFHQANLRINQMVATHLGLPEENVVNTIMWSGNTTAATLPICMCEAIKQGKLHSNDLVLLCGFGAGFTWGATLLHW